MGLSNTAGSGSASLGSASLGFASLASSTSLVLWLDASDLSTITTETGVSEWRDKSGNGNHVTQSTADDQPSSGTATVNSLNVIDFDDPNDFLERASYVQGPLAASTIFLVGVNDNTGNIQQFYMDGHESSGRHAIFVDSRIADPRGFAMYSGTSIISNVVTAQGTASLMTAVFNGASSAGYIDSVLKMSGDAGSQPMSGVVVGGVNTPTGNLDGKIAEIRIFNGALSDDERGQVEAELMTKWGL